jgi:hypothetical protein
MNTYAVIRYEGKLVKVVKQPFESEEQAKDRAWYIAKHCLSDPLVLREVKSRQWANEKFYGMKYSNNARD